ncbi:hypothetical protein CPT_Mater73 [Bacillus phage Mater]|uniref:Uncharacterized protein n=1 Tax=Bacillus phage Mater TaxID=1540090 RepID=A0A0A0RME4_9CAUD|nr:hypothetical protein CPT_Mater73 [Bacillus phage Mater]AIW03230.1 hypothetical protein CPT_Mater73 [Bacillus phage Mater]
MLKKVRNLQEIANVKYVGKYYRLPLEAIFTGHEPDDITICLVLAVDLHEGYVEFTYGHEEGDDDPLWESIKIEQFEKYAQQIDWEGK